jgi:hypothetical protein
MNCSAAVWLPSRPTQPACTLDHPLNPTDRQYRFGGASNAAEQRDGHILITRHALVRRVPASIQDRLESNGK